MDRIDALKGLSRRYDLFEGRTLSEELDGELQQIVVAASAALDMPIALVSLVLERTQFFRAHHGLPPDLAIARGTDRDVSFCQFVVRDGTEFVVTDADNDDRVPKDLVERYGIKAYLGSPIRMGNVVVGSLCTIGLAPRDFDNDARTRLAELAARASARLAELAATRRPPASVLERTGRVAFAEIRNVLVPLLLSASAARVAIVDLAPLARLGRELPDAAKAYGSLVQAADAVEDLRELIEVMAEAGEALRANIDALSKVLVSGADTSIAEVVQASERLAHHHTKLVGGVRWPARIPERAIHVTRGYAVCVVTAALSTLAGELRSCRVEGGIEVRFELVADTLHMRLEVGGPEPVKRGAADLREVVSDDSIKVRADGSALVIELDLVDNRVA